jgi:hypothetical protein
VNESVVGAAKRNTWARGCLGLVIASWALLAYLGLADAILSEDTASDSSFTPVYALIGVVTVAAPVVGIAALAAVRRRGQAWLAHLAFGLALLLPTLYTIAILLFAAESGPSQTD